MERIIPIRIRLEAKDASDQAAKLQVDLQQLAKQIKAAKNAGDEDILAPLLKAQAEYRQELKETNRALRLNGEFQAATKKQLPTDSIRQLRLDYRKLKAEIIDLSTSSPEFEKQSKAALQLKKRLSGLEAEFGVTSREVGNYQEAIENALQATGSLFTGNSRDILSIASDISILGGAAGGIFGTVLDVGSEAVNQVAELIEEVEELKLAVSNTLQSSSSETLEFTARLKGISEVLETDFNDTLRAANSISVEFGEDFADSLDLVEKGLIRVADRGEFLDQLDEFSGKAKQAGIDARDLASILVTSQQQSTFNDSLIDSAIEGTLRLREQTNSTRQSLINAFGEEFTSKLFNNIKDGSITAFEGLRQVGKALQDDTVNAQQFQEVISSISDSAETSTKALLNTLTNLGDETERSIDRTSKYIERLEKLSLASQNVARQQVLLSTQLSGVKDSFDLQSKIIEERFLSQLNKAILVVRALSKSLGRLAKGNFREAFDFQGIANSLASTFASLISSAIP